MTPDMSFLDAVPASLTLCPVCQEVRFKIGTGVTLENGDILRCCTPTCAAIAGGMDGWLSHYDAAWVEVKVARLKETFSTAVSA